MTLRLLPALLVLALSGCATTDHVALHKQTLNQLKASELSILNKINYLELQISNQSDYIESLEDEVLVLQSGLEQSRSVFNEQLDDISEKSAQPPIVVTQEQMPAHGVVLGSVERVKFDAMDASFDARVDTGAATSSLNAADIEQFERNGKRWVRFHIADDEGNMVQDEQSELIWVEAPVVRMAKIRQSSNDEAERRFVIEMWVQLGDVHEKAQFTLADRSQMSHPVLLGREFIRDIAVVDVSKQYIHTDSKQK
ncbi:ATP-dependent zinc protease [Vibrio sp. FNV 38]|nr:ATP-dependent zinc protease [Vibrio sp. FNV 38]